MEVALTPSPFLKDCMRVRFQPKYTTIFSTEPDYNEMFEQDISSGYIPGNNNETRLAKEDLNPYLLNLMQRIQILLHDDTGDTVVKKAFPDDERNQLFSLATEAKKKGNYPKALEVFLAVMPRYYQELIKDSAAMGSNYSDLFVMHPEMIDDLAFCRYLIAAKEQPGRADFSDPVAFEGMKEVFRVINEHKGYQAGLGKLAQATSEVTKHLNNIGNFELAEVTKKIGTLLLQNMQTLVQLELRVVMSHNSTSLAQEKQEIFNSLSLLPSKLRLFVSAVANRDLHIVQAQGLLDEVEAITNRLTGYRDTLKPKFTLYESIWNLGYEPFAPKKKPDDFF